MSQPLTDTVVSNMRAREVRLWEAAFFLEGFLAAEKKGSLFEATAFGDAFLFTFCSLRDLIRDKTRARHSWTSEPLFAFLAEFRNITTHKSVPFSILQRHGAKRPTGRRHYGMSTRSEFDIIGSIMLGYLRRRRAAKKSHQVMTAIAFLSKRVAVEGDRVAVARLFGEALRLAARRLRIQIS